jgi:hypothetical protein
LHWRKVKDKRRDKNRTEDIAGVWRRKVHYSMELKVFNETPFPLGEKKESKKRK